MKTILLALIITLFTSQLIAQTVDDGKRFLYYEKYKSAKDVFQKLTSANPNDETASYYLGQAMLGLQDIAGAKALYLQKYSATPNSPLILAGIGHVGLLEGNLADARSRFETAINLSAGKRIDVLNAVGYANGNPEIKNGDAAFAVDKLLLATTLKGFKSPEVWTNLGDAYRKNSDGTNAIRSYTSALELDPKYVRAIYRTGRLYQAQGYSQEPLYLSKYEEVMKIDPNFAPVYNTLFNYYYATEVSKSAIYMEKWLANSDDDGSACYYRASMKFAQGQNNEVIIKANECIAAGGANTSPNLYGLKAFAQQRINDSVGAKASFEQYFQKQSPAKIGAGDYNGYANALLKFTGNEELAASYFEKAVTLDTLEANKVSYLKSIAVAYRAIKNYNASASIYNRIVSIKKSFTNVDVYNAGIDYYRSHKFDSAVMLFNKYSTKYPDDIVGYYYNALSTVQIDTTMALGQAAAAYTKVIEVGEKYTDKAKVKDELAESYNYMGVYAFNIKKDQAGAIAYVDKTLAIDPTNAEALQRKGFFTKNNPNAIKPTTKIVLKPSETKTTGTKPTTKPANTVKPTTTAKPTSIPKAVPKNK